MDTLQTAMSNNHFVAAELLPVLLVGGPENPVSLSLVLLGEAAGQFIDPFGGSISVPVSLGVPFDIPGKGRGSNLRE